MASCNCDENANVWRIDSGLFTTLSEFPVKEVSLGDLGGANEPAQVVLHPMLCTGKWVILQNFPQLFESVFFHTSIIK